MIPEPVSLVLRPTPHHRLPRLSAQLGADIWIKRDDLTGFALGGNKGRKLEYLIAEALSRGADTIVTCGAVQSNFIRQLGAACAMFEMDCQAVVMDLPFEYARPKGPALASAGGNELLDRLLGVDLHRVEDGPWETLYAQADELADRLEARGRRVYRIPVGGSSALGAYAFTRAAVEVQAAEEHFDWIVTATSSGSTQTGLTWALHDGSTRVLGIACDPEPEIAEDFVRLSAELDALTGHEKALTPRDFEIDFRFVGPGYGARSAEGDAAIVRLAQTEGIFLDPIYSAKAFSGLLKRIEEGSLTGRILFWHTGGIPALFA